MNTINPMPKNAPVAKMIPAMEESEVGGWWGAVGWDDSVKGSIVGGEHPTRLVTIAQPVQPGLAHSTLVIVPGPMDNPVRDP